MNKTKKKLRYMTIANYTFNATMCCIYLYFGHVFGIMFAVNLMWMMVIYTGTANYELMVEGMLDDMKSATEKHTVILNEMLDSQNTFHKTAIDRWKKKTDDGEGWKNN